MPRRTGKVLSFKSYGAKGGLSKKMGRLKSCPAVRAEEEAQTGKAKAFEETSKAFFREKTARSTAWNRWNLREGCALLSGLQDCSRQWDSEN